MIIAGEVKEMSVGVIKVLKNENINNALVFNQLIDFGEEEFTFRIPTRERRKSNSFKLDSNTSSRKMA